MELRRMLLNDRARLKARMLDALAGVGDTTTDAVWEEGEIALHVRIPCTREEEIAARARPTR